MNRTVRNGLAVATMAGGIWLLGQAVASADEVSGTAESAGGTAVTQVDGSSSAQGGEAYGHAVSNQNGQDASGGANVGEVDSGNTVQTGTGGGSGEPSVSTTTSGGGGGGGVSENSGGTTVTSGGNSVSNSGADGGTASNSTTVTGNTSANGGAATGGDASGSAESVGGSSGSSAGSVASSSGSGTGASTTVDGSASADGGYAEGHSVDNTNVQYAGGGINAGGVSSGNHVTVVCFNWKAVDSCNTVVTSGGNAVSNSGANGGTATNTTTVGGNTSANGGTAAGGSASGTAESVDLSDFLDWLSGHFSGSTPEMLSDSEWWEYLYGAATYVDGSTSADGGAAYGHAVSNQNGQDVSGGSNVAVIHTGNEVLVYCFNWKAVDSCNTTITSGGNSISNHGANGGTASNGTHVSGNTSADGGKAMGGSATGSSEDVGGYGSGSSTWVDGSTSADGGTAYGHWVDNDNEQYATGGLNYGHISTGNHVTVYCFNWKSTNSCNTTVDSGGNSVVNEGANGGHVSNELVVCGDTSANGGGAAHEGSECPVAEHPTTPAEPTHPAQPETPAQPAHPAPAAAVQHVAPVVAGSAPAPATAPR